MLRVSPDHYTTATYLTGARKPVDERAVDSLHDTWRVVSYDVGLYGRESPWLAALLGGAIALGLAGALMSGSRLRWRLPALVGVVLSTPLLLVVLSRWEIRMLVHLPVVVIALVAMAWTGIRLGGRSLPGDDPRTPALRSRWMARGAVGLVVLTVLSNATFVDNARI